MMLVLVGRKTVETDDPELTVRTVKGRNPYRIVLDKDLNLSLRKKIFNDKFIEKTIVITSHTVRNLIEKRRKFEKKGIRIITVRSLRNGLLDLKEAMSKLSNLWNRRCISRRWCILLHRIFKTKSSRRDDNFYCT